MCFFVFQILHYSSVDLPDKIMIPLMKTNLLQTDWDCLCSILSITRGKPFHSLSGNTVESFLNEQGPKETSYFIIIVSAEKRFHVSDKSSPPRHAVQYLKWILRDASDMTLPSDVGLLLYFLQCAAVKSHLIPVLWLLTYERITQDALWCKE